MATNPLSAMSYTNKDFNTIYVELLDIIKELSSKWDPTISNESDPGVLLLKVNAIIADKNNYNIDKNILELFPQTVTQDYNARNIYSQLGYKMPWYKSATSTVTFKWVGRELVDGESLTIPKYTMLTNSDSTVVYTLLREVMIGYDNPVATAPVIEGTFQSLSINGSNVIQLLNLDDNRRIYFPDYTVAENGIFVSNTGTEYQWEQVPNLQVCPRGNTYYEFGIDSRSSMGYIEFPEDIHTLIKDGLTVQYVVSQGAYGNISALTLDRFYSDVTVTLGTESIVLSADTVNVYNPAASVDGADPQSIDDAYRSFKKTVHTFDTLVTLRDYANAIYSSGLVSNVIVSDRTTDIQTAYEVLTEDTVNPVVIQSALADDNPDIVSYYKTDNYVSDKTYVYDNNSKSMSLLTEAPDSTLNMYLKSSDDFAMNAYDLKLYLLHTPKLIATSADYQSTFELERNDSVTTKDVKNYVYDQQCVQHDFKPLLNNLPCLFKNSYPISMRIIPQHFLTTIQQDQLKRNIVSSLWKVCNSHAIDFGEQPNYDIIYDTILNSDERIKVVILDDFTYTTFATYWDDNSNTFKDIPISNSNSKLIKTFTMADNNSDPTSEQYLNDVNTILSTYKTFTTDWTRALLQKAYFICDDNGYVYRYNTDIDKFYCYSTLRKDIQTEIISRSVIAGRTPLIESVYDFDIALNHKLVKNADIDRITTALAISPFSDETNTTVTYDKETRYPILTWNDDTDTNTAETLPFTSSYRLKDNESIRFFAPSFESIQSYANYTKFQLVLNNQTGTHYELQKWSANIANDTSYLMDKTDYNTMVYDYIKGSVLVFKQVGNSTLYRIYADADCKRKLACRNVNNTFTLLASEWDYVPEGADINNYHELWNVDTSGGSTKIYITVNSTNYYLACEFIQEGTYTYNMNASFVGTENTAQEQCDVNSIAVSASLCLVTDSSEVSDEDCKSIGNFKRIDVKKDWQKISLSNKVIPSYVELIEGVSITANDIFFYKSNVNTVDKITVTYQKDSETSIVSFNSAATAFSNSKKYESAIYFLTSGSPGCVILNYYIDNSDMYLDVSTFDNISSSSSSDSNYITISNGMYSGDERWIRIVYQKPTINYGSKPEFNSQFKDVAVALYYTWKAVDSKLRVYLQEAEYIIPANSDYQLQEGDSITFFYRTDPDSEDSAYKYEHYAGTSNSNLDDVKHSPIIRPSFEVHGVSSTNDSIVDVSKLSETGLIESGTSDYSKVFNMYGDFELSGSRSIETRKLKQTTLDPKQHKYYFITNSITGTSESKKYTMKLSCANYTESLPSDASLTYSYILQADEYFVMTNSKYTEYLIFHPGTYIGLKTTNSGSDISYDVSYVPYTEIMKQGIAAFSDYCCTPTQSELFFAREQQVHNLVSGDTISLTRKSADNSKTLVTITSWADLALANQDYDITYTTKSGQTIMLPPIVLQDTTYGWTGRAYLNLNTSIDTPQHIFSNSNNKSFQQIIITDESSNALDIGKLNQNSTSLSDYYIQSSIPIQHVGGIDVDVRYIDEYGDVNPVKIYCYEVDITLTNLTTRSSDNKLVFDSSSNQLSIPCSNFIADAEYLIAIKVEGNRSSTVELRNGNTVIDPINNGVSPSSGYIYFQYIPNTSTTSSNNLTISVSNTLNEPTELVFEPIKVVNQLDLFNTKYDISSSQILDKVKSLDVHNLFKYNYIVTADDEQYIEDPLDSVSFFDLNHVMNSHVISKAELQMSRGEDSFIMLVNNR